MIAIILGTRPEIIKMSPVIRACEALGEDYFTFHTGQHYSYEMDRAFFEELELPQPEYNPDVGSGTHAEQAGKAFKMNENDLCAILVISYAVCRAFSNPVSNLLNILSPTRDTYAVIGAQGQIHFQKLNDSVHMCTFPYQPESSLVMKIFRHSILQLKISFKLISSRKYFQDIIYFMIFPPLLPMIAAKICNKKVYWLLSAKIALSPNDTSKLAVVLSEICCNLCNNIILYSPSLVSSWNLERYRHKILIAHEHFLDFKRFTITTPLLDRPSFIGYIGRLSEEKGVQHFVQAVPTVLSNRQDLWVLIGGDGELRESIEASLQEGGVTARVDLPGWISHDDLPNYLNQLRLLVLPSYTEGLPNIMLEAMACGTPVLATPVGAIPDVIIDGETGFIMENNTPECIAANVTRALNTPDLEQIAENGRRFVEENFSFESTVALWKEVIQEI